MTRLTAAETMCEALSLTFGASLAYPESSRQERPFGIQGNHDQQIVKPGACW